MAKLITTGLVPNLFASDVWEAARMLVSPSKWLEGEAAARLEERFEEYLGVSTAVSFQSGRSAMLAILKCLGVGEGDEILMQAFTCVAAVNPILWAGAKPVFVDVEEETFNMNPYDLERKITPRSKAVLVQHTFGKPANIEKILRIAKDNNLLVIEDCAHALGAEYKGQKVGTFGKMAFFSFGRDKVISSVFGGMAVTNDAVLGKKIEEFHQSLGFPSRLWVGKQLLYPVLMGIVLSTYSLFGLGKLLHAVFRGTHLLSTANTSGEKKRAEKPPFVPAKMPNSLASLALHQLDQLKDFNRKRVELAQFYSGTLGRFDLRLPTLSPNEKHIFLRYAIMVENSEALLEFAKKKGVFLGDWYRIVVAPEDVNLEAAGYAGGCPVAEELVAKVVNLPNHPRMSKKDAEKVVEVLDEYFRG